MRAGALRSAHDRALVFDRQRESKNHRAVYQTHRKWALLSEDVSHHHILLLGSGFRQLDIHSMYSKQQMLPRWPLYFVCVCVRARHVSQQVHGDTVH